MLMIQLCTRLAGVVFIWRQQWWFEMLQLYNMLPRKQCIGMLKFQAAMLCYTTQQIAESSSLPFDDQKP
jgi:hypothetical protein